MISTIYISFFRKKTEMHVYHGYKSYDVGPEQNLPENLFLILYHFVVQDNYSDNSTRNQSKSVAQIASFVVLVFVKEGN